MSTNPSNPAGTTPPVILIVDDDLSVTTSLSLLLKQNGYASAVAHEQSEAMDRLAKQRFDLVLQDMNFSRGTTGDEGLALLRRIRAARPTLPVILMTAWGSISLAVEGVKSGAVDFITKPWSNAQLLKSVETVLALSISGAIDRDRQAVGRTALDQRHDFAPIIGRDPRLVKVLELVARVSPTDASVLITGESGTGKELVAEAIHRNSRRRGGPFVKVNLGGISASLFESEMFGHVRGAFTDARGDRKGRFEMADRGTIFLDEIGELDPAAQVKMLRVLQDRTYEVLGSSTPRTVDVRVISATNRPLHEMVAGGEFREDLLYRLNLITIEMPPLRDRRGDIPLLVAHFVRSFASSYRRAELSISPQAVEWLKQRNWPGNIRQLRQAIERAVLVRDSEHLDVDDFLAVSGLERRELRAGELPEAGSMTLDEIERAMIVKCLHHYGGNVSRVAEALGLSRAALYRRFEKYGLGSAEP